ncbi:MAG: hypothetical protein A2Y82_01230 [Candidatus Buchananbacteria bacterium RBG_13_36_9]|uniref:Uncharacterized protein n=1 Tax=Candidatus Buchananbacteria bacterium RBG_13_36_9 TaxID=1797530 RepID=A0A1G1XN86_9BACT|nr:MAG: hypothetical protein A2Y82_01230 [Candidatus Buchananbacteria bacterium RBG_13_36_9]
MKGKIAVLLVVVLLTFSPACAHLSNQRQGQKVEQPKVGLQDYHPPLKNVLFSQLINIGVKIYRK